MGYYFNTKSKASRKEETPVAKKIVVDHELDKSKKNEGIFDNDELVHNEKALNYKKIDDAKKIDAAKKMVVDRDITINKETSIKNAIILKIGCNKQKQLNEKSIKKMSDSKKIMLSSWNVNCGINAGSPVKESILYKNNNPLEKVVFMSTWEIKCGIATYTSHLLNSINKLYGEKIAEVFPMNKRDEVYEIESDLIHLQHEFGIMPKEIDSASKVLITFHAVFKTPKYLMNQLENNLNVVGYIVHSKIAGRVLRMNTKRAVYIIPHGSEIIKLLYESKSLIRKELNFDKIGIKDTDKCAFVFGFQSDNKNFNQIISACKNTEVKLIISGAVHECDYRSEIFRHDKANVIILDRFLNDTEIDMYASACDLLIFDYISQKHYSCSGAMHRVVGSGNPVICSRINHFSDIIENEQCLKFSDQKELELKIKEGLEKWDEYSKKALDYANLTSWKNVAKMHLDVYKKYENIDVVTDCNTINNNDISNNVIINKET